MYIFFRFSLFNHPEVTCEFLEINKDDPTREQLCREIAKPGYEFVTAMTSPRFIKTHFPFSMLPSGLLDIGCKVRNSKKLGNFSKCCDLDISLKGRLCGSQS